MYTKPRVRWRILKNGYLLYTVKLEQNDYVYIATIYNLKIPDYCFACMNLDWLKLCINFITSIWIDGIISKQNDQTSVKQWETLVEASKGYVTLEGKIKTLNDSQQVRSHSFLV